jgi:hypothetical protein
LQIECGGIPHLAKNERDAPNFPHAALGKSACAPFFKERRMKLVEPNKFYGKSGIWGTQGSVAAKGASVLSGPVVENNPADCHGHQQEAGEEEQQPGHYPPDAGLRGQNAPLGLETVCLAQYPGQQQEETYRKH